MQTIVITSQAEWDAFITSTPQNIRVIIKSTERIRIIIRYVPHTCSVEARGASYIEARGSSHVSTWGTSRVDARDSSHVIAWEFSRVSAEDSVCVWEHSSRTDITLAGQAVCFQFTNHEQRPIHAAPGTTIVKVKHEQPGRRNGRKG